MLKCPGGDLSKCMSELLWLWLSWVKFSMCVHYLPGFSSCIRSVAICWIILRTQGWWRRHRRLGHLVAPDNTETVSVDVLFLSVAYWFVIWISSLFLSVTHNANFQIIQTCHDLHKACHVLLVVSCHFFSWILLRCIRSFHILYLLFFSHALCDFVCIFNVLTSTPQHVLSSALTLSDNV